ncbi:hypothetical protein quinque_005673 [Culex quinquefasciatus]
MSGSVKVCRICLMESEPGTDMVSIFTEREALDEVVANMIIDCFSVLVSEQDGYSPWMCGPCLTRLEGCYLLRRQYDESCRKCPNCPKSFAHKSQLKIHQVYHLDLKPYKCETCPETFRLKNQLKIHNRRHTGERPFRCQYCQMGFSHGTDRKRHEMAAHTGEKPHKCRICKSAFVRHQQLVAHMVSGHGRTREAPFRCEFCKQDFRQSAELERHENQDHGIQDVGTIVANGVEMQYAVAYV